MISDEPSFLIHAACPSCHGCVITAIPTYWLFTSDFRRGGGTTSHVLVAASRKLLFLYSLDSNVYNCVPGRRMQGRGRGCRRYPIQVRLYQLGVHQGSYGVSRKPYCCIQGGGECCKDENCYVLRPATCHGANRIRWYGKHSLRRSTPHRQAHPLNRHHATRPFLSSSHEGLRSLLPSPVRPTLLVSIPRTSPTRSLCSLGPLSMLLLSSI